MKSPLKLRNSLHNLSIPMPIQKHFSGESWRVDLSSNTNPFGKIFAAYPDVLQFSLKKRYLKIITSLKAPPVQKVALSEKNVLFTAGSIEGIDLLLRAFPEPAQDEVYSLSPTFSAYKHLGAMNGFHVKQIPFYGKNLDQVDVDALVMLNPKMLFLCNPNNPTGTIISQKVIEKLCQGLEGLV